MSLDYVARCRHCGGISFWTAGDRPAKELAKDVAAVIRDGRQIERMDTEAVRSAQWCDAECRRARTSVGVKQEEMFR